MSNTVSVDTAPNSQLSNQKLLKVERYFTKGLPSGRALYDTIEWEKRDVEIVKPDGEIVFSQEGVESPKAWSHQATQIVASKYFRGHDQDRETSIKDLIDRVVCTISDGAVKYRYMDPESAQNLEDELRYLCMHQMMAWNSPVWFNVGTTEKPQISACFIVDVEDDMESILSWYYKEGMIFKGGSGSGVNLSKLREKNARLAGGGFASGPLSFAMAADTSAGTIKSGGKNRRAAKMLLLDTDHPDIEEFIDVKSKEGEVVAKALIKAGFSTDFTDEKGAYAFAPWQNANNSIRASHAFMKAAEKNESWVLKSRVEGGVDKVVQAKGIMDRASQAAWECGDPGMQFHDTINEWHTCINDGEIVASNPCCFVGETLVDTSEGRISIRELAELSLRGGELPYAFSHDLETGMPVLRKITKGWKAGETCNLVRVVTDKGVSVLCTPEHKFLTYDGKYVEAQKLAQNTRLRKTARWRNEHRSNRYCLNMKATPDNPGGTVWQSRFMWEQINGSIPEGMQVHHINEDPTDDRMSNFELAESGAHQSNHSVGPQNARFLEVSVEDLAEVWEEIEAAPRKTHKNKPMVTPSRWNKYIKDAGLKGKVPMAASSSNGGKIQGVLWSEFEKVIEEHRSAVNDRVLRVEKVTLDRPVEVFDLEVEGTHNFAVSMGETDHSIVVSNSEYLFLNNTSCNLLSHNLRKFSKDGVFNVEDFMAATRVAIMSMEILISLGGFPTDEITKGSQKYRTLGIGYSNLGGLLMENGIAYDSDEGRQLAAAITSLLTAVAYNTSAEIAARVGAFEGYFRNQEPMTKVMEKHRAAHIELESKAEESLSAILQAAGAAWDRNVSSAKGTGFRNAQASVLAPAGTISFFMDCDTTGVEPELALTKYKRLVGGGVMKIVNQLVPEALKSLGYDQDQINEIVAYVDEKGTVEGAPHVRQAHLPVFDCSFKSPNSTRTIPFKGHVDMMAAVQPFISGAISKTVNVDNSATSGDIYDAYMYAWKKGLKAIAVYRDGCKQSQPLNTSEDQEEEHPPITSIPIRQRLPDTRSATVHKFSISGIDGYITLGYYPDTGKLGEVFVTVSKQGSTLAGLLDGWATLLSISLQHGVPVENIVEKFRHTNFEPSGFTSNPDVRRTSSILDYIVRVMEQRATINPVEVEEVAAALPPEDASASAKVMGPPCSDCGNLTVRSGTCYVCQSCGTTTGCG